MKRALSPLRPRDSDKIVSTYTACRSVLEYAHPATFDQTGESWPNRLEAALAQTRKQIAQNLKESGYGA